MIFSRFSQLSPELRFMIWKFALPERDYRQGPRDIWPVRYGDNLEYDFPPPPVLLRTCRESRHLALKSGKWERCAEGDDKIRWIDHNINLLYVSGVRRGNSELLSSVLSSREQHIRFIATNFYSGIGLIWRDTPDQAEEIFHAIQRMGSGSASADCKGTYGVEAVLLVTSIFPGVSTNPQFFQDTNTRVVELEDPELPEVLGQFTRHYRTGGLGLWFEKKYPDPHAQVQILKQNHPHHWREHICQEYLQSRLGGGLSVPEEDNVLLYIPGKKTPTINLGHPWVKSQLATLPDFRLAVVFENGIGNQIATAEELEAGKRGQEAAMNASYLRSTQLRRARNSSSAA